MTAAKTKLPLKIILLGLILILGVIFARLGWFDWQFLLERGEQFAHFWWFAPAVIAAKVLLYAFGLPGSSLIWIAGLFFPPVVATMIIVCGGVGGALAAYTLSRWVFSGIDRRLASSRLFQFMSHHSDWPTLCALRTLPNFPHSALNYGAGCLAVPLPRFLFSTVVGFAAKGFLYASMIRGAATADTLAEAFDLKTLGPLFALVALFLAGKMIQRRISGQHRDEQ